jgi:hypothetical protein
MQDRNNQRIVVTKFLPGFGEVFGHFAINGVMHLGAVHRNLVDFAAFGAVYLRENRLRCHRPFARYATYRQAAREFAL